LEAFKMSRNETPLDKSPQWAVNIIHTCMAVQPGEKVLVVVDEPLSDVRDDSFEISR
jgi:hypothetical protein